MTSLHPIVLLGDRGTCVCVCEQLAQFGYVEWIARSQNGDLFDRNLDVLADTAHATPNGDVTKIITADRRSRMAHPDARQ